MLLFVKNLLFTVLVPGTVAVFVPLFVLDHAAAEISVGALAGGLLVLIGATIYFWCLWDFATVGRGTPAPIDPPKHLVIRGLYRHTRNPMYVGVLCVIAGWALFFQAQPFAIYWLCTATFFHLFVVLYEEPHLKLIFGPTYEEYCAQVGRWLPFRKQRAAA